MRNLLVMAMLAMAMPASAADSGNGNQARHKSPVISLIIDDLGPSYADGRRVLELPGPVVVALLPGTPYARRLARDAGNADREILLHLPMQPINGADPGPCAVLLDMEERELRDVLDRAFAEIPGAIGLNNHMGSLITQHPGHMTWLMRALRERDPELVFVDSRTSAQSIAVLIAEEHAVPHLERDVFLDNERDEASIRRQFRRLVASARRNGSAVGIGHPYPETLDMLEQELPVLLDGQDVKLVSLRELLERRSALPHAYPGRSYGRARPE